MNVPQSILLLYNLIRRESITSRKSKKVQSPTRHSPCIANKTSTKRLADQEDGTPSRKQLCFNADSDK